MSTVFANGRAILHAGDGVDHVSAPPDVCKTPTPGGPVPIPYVNIATDSDLHQGTKGIQIEGKSVALASSCLSTSTGDEAGTAGGIISSKTKGKLTWTTSSSDVVFEGTGVVRFMDATQHNGNTFNSAFVSAGGTGLAYADDFDGLCPICEKGPKEHRILEKEDSAELCRSIVEKLKKNFASCESDDERKQYARPEEKEEGGVSWGGYMVGVMICTCKKSYATMSGSNLKGFDEVAGSLVDTIITGGPATLDDFVNANTSKGPVRSKKTNTIKAAWTKVQEIRKYAAKDKKQGYNAPGNCAGAKLLAKSGHSPIQMTEMFFMPPWKATYRWRRTELTRQERTIFERSSDKQQNKILQNEEAKKEPTTFTTGESVGSCHTCQNLLFLTMCPERTC